MLDPKDDSPGTTLVVEIGKPSGKGFLVFNSGSAVVPPASKSDGPFEVFVRAPAPGTYALRVRVENKDRGSGKLIVAKAAKKP